MRAYQLQRSTCCPTMSVMYFLLCPPNTRWQHSHNTRPRYQLCEIEQVNVWCENAFLAVCSSTFENCRAATNLFDLNNVQYCHKTEYIPNDLQDRIHARYLNRMHKHNVDGREKKRCGRVWSRRQYIDTFSATHDLNNEVTTYILSANQRLANQSI